MLEDSHSSQGNKSQVPCKEEWCPILKAARM
jgi:hypothetical protein